MASTNAHRSPISRWVVSNRGRAGHGAAMRSTELTPRSSTKSLGVRKAGAAVELNHRATALRSRVSAGGDRMRCGLDQGPWLPEGRCHDAETKRD